MQINQTWEIGACKKVGDFTGDVGFSGGEMLQRRGVCDSAWNLPRREGVVVDVDAVEVSESDEEIWGEGTEVVVVGEKDLKRSQPRKAWEGPGELVGLNFQLLQICEVFEFRWK